MYPVESSSLLQSGSSLIVMQSIGPADNSGRTLVDRRGSGRGKALEIDDDLGKFLGVDPNIPEDLEVDDGKATGIGADDRPGRALGVDDRTS